MRLLDSLRFRLSTLFRREHLNDEMVEEIRSHIQMRADDLERSGLSRAEAERQARIEFGSQQAVREDCQQAAGISFIESLFMDARFAIRILRKSPAFTIVAVLTLALAIGANAIVFSVLNGLILHPLDLPHPGNLYQLAHAKDAASSQSYQNYVDLRDRNRSFENLAGYTISAAGMNAADNPSRVWVILATGNYFDALNVQPFLGRFFHGADEHGPNSAPLAVLSHSYWHTHFQDDPSVIGRVVELNKHSFTIIGVAPSNVRGTLVFFNPDFFVPFVNQQQIDGTDYVTAPRTSRWMFEVFGRLKPGVTHEQAIADMNSIGADLERTYPPIAGQMSFRLARPGLYGDFLGRPVRAFVLALTLLAALILLAACANLGSLFAARATDRAREVALRLALGSTRGRVLRQLLTEAVLIALVGGALGLWASVFLLRALSTWQPLPRFPIHIPVTPDVNVYMVALALAFVSGLLFGLVPLRQVQTTDPYQVIKSGTTGTVGRRITARDLLLGSQIAICAVLVTASLVAVRGLIRSLNGDYGFQPQNVMLVDTDLSMANYRDADVPAMQKKMIDALQTIPGVEAVASNDWPPLSQDWQPTNVYKDETTDLRSINAAFQAYQFLISPDYFRAANTPLLAGRTFTWHDDEKSPRVAVINEEFARRMFGSPANAIGTYYKMRDGGRVQIVGIVGTGKYATLSEDPKAAMFLPTTQLWRSQTWLFVRSNRDPSIAADIRNTLRGIDAELPLSIETWEKELDGALFASRVATLSLGVLGFIGAILSVTGVFGMAAYAVSKRLRDFGIRMALGAPPMHIIKAALARPFKLLAAGSCIGLLLGLLATKVLAYIVYQATPRDPVVLGGVVLAMALLGMLATWIPAQRALSVDPLELLREE